VIGLATVPDNEQGIIEDLGAGVIEGAHVIFNRFLSHLECLLYLGDEKIIHPMANEWEALSRG
jgi:hypothetical protein